MTKCPRTNLEVSTVYRMNSEQLDALEGEFAFRCKACDEIHRWSRSAAWVELSPEKPLVV